MKTLSVREARKLLYQSGFAMKEETYRIVLDWIKHGVPMHLSAEMQAFEKAAIQFGRAKARAADKRDKWKRKKRMDGKSESSPIAG